MTVTTAMPARGLYAITTARSGVPLVDHVADVIDGGARVVQYRDKSRDAAHRRREASALLSVCRKAGVPLIINDDVELAATMGADGVHLGRGDPDPAAARKHLGNHAIIGVSCYNQLARAHQALAVGASYVAFGSFFASPTKPQAVRADIELLKQARRELACPIVAIGGITPANGGALIAAGADFLAVIGGLAGDLPPAQAAGQYAALFTQHQEEHTP